MRIRLITATVFLLCLTALAPAVAFGTDVHYRVSEVDYRAGTVTVSATSDTTQAAFVLYVNGAEVSRRTSAEGTSNVSFDPYRLTSLTTFHLEVSDAEGLPVWSWDLPVDPVALRPAAPVMAVPSGALVSSAWTARGVASGAVAVRATDVDSGRESVAAVDQGGSASFALPDRSMPLGETYYKVVAENAFGRGPVAKLHVYRLPSGMPKRRHYVFASKKILWMFDVKDGRVVHRWPIAIGTQRTPTPSGTFKIGRARRSGGPWGPMRRRLWKVRTGRHSLATRYWIHGNNASWTIGTPASHGCIRMYNKDIREFKRVVPTGTWVVIR